MVTADARCKHPSCTEKNIYRMVGACSNCGGGDILILYTSGHTAHSVDCPLCGNNTVSGRRLATDDEIPAA